MQRISINQIKNKLPLTDVNMYLSRVKQYIYVRGIHFRNRVQYWDFVNRVLKLRFLLRACNSLTSKLSTMPTKLVYPAGCRTVLCPSTVATVSCCQHQHGPYWNNAMFIRTDICFSALLAFFPLPSYILHKTIRDGSDGIANRHGGGRDFRTRSDRSWGPTSLLTMGRVSFPGVKQPGRGINRPPYLAPR